MIGRIGRYTLLGSNSTFERLEEFTKSHKNMTADSRLRRAWRSRHSLNGKTGQRLSHLHSESDSPS